MRTNQEWLRALRANGIEQQDALKDLRERLLLGMRAYLAKDRSYKSVLVLEDAREVVEDCAQEALLIIREKINAFRGESRFTTWATTIAIRLLLGELRRRKWNQLSIENAKIGYDFPGQPAEALQSGNPEMALQQKEVWSLLKRIVEKELTSRQRFVLIASAFQGMPLDLIAATLGTNRDNVYKILHDARKKLKRCLTKRGLTAEELISLSSKRKI
jgi:RNA polymerase sigma-70 factor, ECF subfamily